MSHHHAHHEVRAAGRVLRLRIWLSSAMWVPVLATNVVAIAAALVLPVIDEHVGERGLPIGRSAVESIFSALAGGMITFTGIVFSAVFVAAQIQTSSYSPRLAARLRRDPVIIAGLALPTATATYSLVALATLGHEDDHGRSRLRARRHRPVRAGCWRSSRSGRSSRSSSARSRARRSAASCARCCAAATP